MSHSHHRPIPCHASYRKHSYVGQWSLYSLFLSNASFGKQVFKIGQVVDAGQLSKEMGFGLDIPFILTLPNLSLWIIDFHGSYVRHDVVVSTSNLQLEDKASKNGTEKPSFREINTWTFKQKRLYFGYFPSLGHYFRNRASRYGTQETNVKIQLRNAWKSVSGRG